MVRTKKEESGSNRTAKARKENDRGDRSRKWFRSDQPANPRCDAEDTCDTATDTANHPSQLRLSRKTERKYDTNRVAYKKDN